MVADDPDLSDVNIAFCRNEVFFYLCNDRSLVKNFPPGYDPVEIYDELVDTAAYTIKVKRFIGAATAPDFAKTYAIDLFGNPGDADASTQDLDVQ